MERWIAKVVSTILVFFVLAGFTALPVKVAPFFRRKGEKGKYWLSLIMCFGGGILLSTYLLQMIPEIRHILERTLLEPYRIRYPLPELFTAAGFFFLIALEKMVVSCDQHGKKTVEYDIEVVDGKTSPNHHYNGVSNGDVNGATTNGAIGYQPNGQANGAAKGKQFEMHIDATTPDVKVVNGSAGGAKQHTTITVDVPDSEKGMMTAEDQNPVRSIILLLALSLDCLFEGLSLGLMRTTPAVWNMFIAIAAHESVVVFTMGLELVKVHPPKRVVFIAIMFGLMCPIGGVIGTCIMEINGAGDDLALAAGILQAITAGMFIYVTFFQILQGEISGHSSMAKLTALLIGFACMAALVAVPGASPTPYGDPRGHLLDALAEDPSLNSTIIFANAD